MLRTFIMLAVLAPFLAAAGIMPAYRAHPDIAPGVGQLNDLRGSPLPGALPHSGWRRGGRFSGAIISSVEMWGRAAPTPLAVAGCAPAHLLCESRLDPLGLTESSPQLSWQVNATEASERGQYQTAYEIQVASAPELLTSNQVDLWDTGQVMTNRTAFIPYAGAGLTSGERCFWHVRVWDKNGQSSGWSPPASWSMGLLNSNDWTAQWISDPILADPANRPLTPIHCYRSELTNRPDAGKWIVLDLGAAKRMDAVDVTPARPRGESWDFRTPMFPLRFKVEAADTRDFDQAHVLVDQTGVDFPNPRGDSCRFTFPAVTERYVRLTVTRLACWDGQDYGLALAGLGIFDGTQSIGGGAGVECSDSIESERWSKKFLVAGQSSVALAGDAPALAAGIPDTMAKFTVSRTPMLRREFAIAGKIRRATLSVTARGFYTVQINGRRVGEDQLTPGYTDYGARLQYQTYEVTGLLHGGTNAIGALLGYGWYAGHMNLSENRCIYGYFPQFLAQLDMELEDGTHVKVGTDGQWRSTLEGPVRWSDLLDGEGYDCRREIRGWDQPGFDDHAWQPVWSQPRDAVPLVWAPSQPVRVIQEMPPVAVKEVKPGRYVFDLGQEITGWCRLKVNGPAGTHVRLRHAEMVSANGDIDTGTLMGTLQEEDYILDGMGERTLEPHFTYHGFRYVELTGLPGALKPDTLVAINVRTDAATTGHFECSNAQYNRIQKATAWTQANLLFDVPAGCAARSERVAWMGDIRPCVQSLLFNFDAAPLLTKYTADMRDDQALDGRFTDIAPQAHLHGTMVCVGSPGWADAGVSLPWDVYVNTGDRRLLAEHFAAAKRWVEAIHASNPDLLWQKNRGMDWGDWLSGGTPTPNEIGATAFFAHSADLLARMATALGARAEAERYQALFQGIRQAFAAKFVSTNGIISEVAPGKPMMRDITALVRSLMKDGNLKFTVKNDVLGGDPAPYQRKTLHLVYRVGKAAQEKVFAEDSAVDFSNHSDQPLEIISASYGFDAAPIDTQGSYALALQFGLLDEPLRSRAAGRLHELVVENGYHPTVGFWSSVELLLALAGAGYNEDAAQLFNQSDEPSWGYMANQNTTMWEAFDANTRNLSLNHWTHSAVNEWLWREVAGLNPSQEQPGYEAFVISPRPNEEVTWCKASYDSIRGRIVSDWKWDGTNFDLVVTIPANTTATVVVPVSGSKDAVTESGRPAAGSEGVRFLRSTLMDEAVYQVGSGRYRFHSRYDLNLATDFHR